MLIVLLFSTILIPVITLLYSYNSLTLAVCGASFLILLASSAFSWSQLRRTNQFTNQAVKVGMALGLLWVFEISINNFIAPPLPQRDIIDNIFWAVISFSIFMYAWLCAYRAQRIRAGIQAGLWSSFVSGTFACCMALSLVAFGMRFITRDPLNISEWAARGADVSAPNMATYFAFETLAGGLMHLVILGVIMGLLLGVLAGILGKTVRVLKSTIYTT